MPERRRAVLLCGQERAVVTAIARELADGVPLVIQASRTERTAAERLIQGLEKRGGSARLTIADLGGDAASRRLIDAAWKASRGFNAVVIAPGLPAAATSAKVELDDWGAGVAAGLRGPFFLAKHAGLRLARAGGGRLVFAIGAAPRDSGPVAAVVHEGLRCMVAALVKALPEVVSVAAVVQTGRRAAAADIAQPVREFIETAHPARSAVLELG